jgi:hypothetical protein
VPSRIGRLRVSCQSSYTDSGNGSEPHQPSIFGSGPFSSSSLVISRLSRAPGWSAVWYLPPRMVILRTSACEVPKHLT